MLPLSSKKKKNHSDEPCIGRIIWTLHILWLRWIETRLLCSFIDLGKHGFISSVHSAGCLWNPLTLGHPITLGKNLFISSWISCSTLTWIDMSVLRNLCKYRDHHISLAAWKLSLNNGTILCQIIQVADRALNARLIYSSSYILPLCSCQSLNTLFYYAF